MMYNIITDGPNKGSPNLPLSAGPTYYNGGFFFLRYPADDFSGFTRAGPNFSFHLKIIDSHMVF